MDHRDGRDQGGGDFGATTPNIRITPSEAATSRRLGQTPPGQPHPQPPAGPPKGRTALKIGLIAGGALLLFLIIGVALVLYLTREPGFTIIVQGTPPGSNVYVDSKPRGITLADGSIRVTGLKSGKRLLRISHEGYEDFNTSVTGKDGDEKPVIAEITPLAKKIDLSEIDYNGPMILIPAGEFTMGSNNHHPNEKPAHSVNLSDYYIDKFEVTNEQYKRFCDATKRKYPTDPWWGPNYFNQPKLPVVGVDYDDAAAYAAWVKKRLPTEEEWEKAASWGPGQATKRMLPWGDGPAAGRANLGSEHSTAVGANPNSASAYGVQDMVGNVLEWVDAYYKPYQGNTAPDPNFGDVNRVVRGGHFKSTAEDARTTRRIYQAPKFTAAEQKERTWLIGFRCVVSANDADLQKHLRSQK